MISWWAGLPDCRLIRRQTRATGVGSLAPELGQLLQHSISRCTMVGVPLRSARFSAALAALFE